MKKIIIYIISSMLFFLSCKKDTVSSISNDGSGIFGIVSDEFGNAIEGADVSCSTSTTQTNVFGIFIFSDINLPEKNAVIHISKTGYFKGTKTIVRPTQNINNVRLTLLTKRQIMVFNTSSGGTVVTTNTKITIPSNAIKNLNGSVYNGAVNVYGKYLDPTDADLANKIPGDLVGENISGEEKLLQTYGMMNIILEDNAGNLLNIADGKKANIEITVPSILSGSAPSAIPLWHFDDSKGIWIEEGQAILNGGKYIGNVSHFSWWNCDMPINTIALKLILKDQNGNVLANSQTRLTDLTTGSISHGNYTDNKGIVSGLVPANAQLKLELDDNTCVNSWLFLQNIMPLNKATTMTITADLHLNNIVIYSGKIIECADKPHSPAFISIPSQNSIFNIKSMLVPIDEQGSFTLLLKNCTADSTFSLFVFNDEVINEPIIIPYSNTDRDLGSIQLNCNNNIQEAEYKLDNFPLVKYSSLSYSKGFPDTLFNPDQFNTYSPITMFGPNLYIDSRDLHKPRLKIGYAGGAPSLVLFYKNNSTFSLSLGNSFTPSFSYTPIFYFCSGKINGTFPGSDGQNHTFYFKYNTITRTR